MALCDPLFALYNGVMLGNTEAINRSEQRTINFPFLGNFSSWKGIVIILGFAIPNPALGK